MKAAIRVEIEPLFSLAEYYGPKLWISRFILMMFVRDYLFPMDYFKLEKIYIL